MILREYQSRTVSDLFAWWTKHQESSDIPLLSLPTAAGKSVICAEIVRQLFDQWPDYQPRTVVLVPSKELAEQNAEKLINLLPKNIHVGFVSASLGKKVYHADVIVATIGSIAKSAHLLGNIKCVIIDECHLVNSKDAGMFRGFLNDLGRYCEFRTVGMTATAFRGNQVWLTDGEAPLFTGIASNVTMRELLDAGFIAPLVPPTTAMVTRIDAGSVGMSNGDYKVNELSDVVEQYLRAVALESVKLASDRQKWIAFTPSVSNAITLANFLHKQGIESAVVCGETPKDERERLIAQFRRGELRCLVTVLALSTGFDVPDVDCIVWCRPTKSPVLYVQGMGRGVRISPGKIDCLVLDFTDTVERLGPVDTIKGRAKAKGGKQEAPFVVCDACGARNHATALVCAECGAVIRELETEKKDAKASTAALLSTHVVAPEIEWHEVSRVAYKIHQKEGKPSSLRVDYYGGILRIASEWVCFDHTGYARQKAESWWLSRTHIDVPKNTEIAFAWANDALSVPTQVAVRKNGKYMEIVSHSFQPLDKAA